MRIEGFWRRLICISIIFALVLSIAFILTPVHVTAPIIPPLPTTVEVLPGENFTLRHRMVWNEPGVLGYYLVAIYWDYFGDNAWHFTPVSAIAYFDNDGDNLPDAGVALIDNTVSTQDNGTRFALVVSNAAGNDNDGYFNVDITLRAAGPDGTPHTVTDDHTIYYTSAQGFESFPYPYSPPPVTVRVLPWTGTGVFGLENLYAVSLDANLWLGEGSKLVVRFYTYGDVFEDENVIETFTIPPTWHVEENEIVPHPLSEEGVQKVELVLVDGTGAEMDTIATFTATRTVLMGRIVEIYLEVPYLPPVQIPEPWGPWLELVNIYLQWPFAPS